MLKYASGKWSERLDSRLVIIPRPYVNYCSVITQSYKPCLTTYLNSLSKHETVSNLKVRPVYYHTRKISIVYQNSPKKSPQNPVIIDLLYLFLLLYKLLILQKIIHKKDCINTGQIDKSVVFYNQRIRKDFCSLLIRRIRPVV